MANKLFTHQHLEKDTEYFKKFYYASNDDGTEKGYNCNFKKGKREGHVHCIRTLTSKMSLEEVCSLIKMSLDDAQDALIDVMELEYSISEIIKFSKKTISKAIAQGNVEDEIISPGITVGRSIGFSNLSMEMSADKMENEGMRGYVFGCREGYNEGIRKGYHEGYELGKNREQIKNILNMKKDMTLEEVALCLGLTKENVQLLLDYDEKLIKILKETPKFCDKTVEEIHDELTVEDEQSSYLGLTWKQAIRVIIAAMNKETDAVNSNEFQIGLSIGYKNYYLNSLQEGLKEGYVLGKKRMMINNLRFMSKEMELEEASLKLNVPYKEACTLLENDKDFGYKELRQA